MVAVPTPLIFRVGWFMTLTKAVSELESVISPPPSACVGVEVIVGVKVPSWL